MELTCKSVFSWTHEVNIIISELPASDVRDRLMRAWHQLPSILKVYNQIMYRGLNIPSGPEHCSLFFYYNSSLIIIQGQHPLNILKIILKPFMPEFGLRLRSTGWQGTIWRDSTVILYILQYLHIPATGGGPGQEDRAEGVRATAAGRQDKRA